MKIGIVIYTYMYIKLHIENILEYFSNSGVISGKRGVRSVLVCCFISFFYFIEMIDGLTEINENSRLKQKYPKWKRNNTLTFTITKNNI